VLCPLCSMLHPPPSPPKAAEFSGRVTLDQEDDADIKRAGYCVASSKVTHIAVSMHNSAQCLTYSNIPLPPLPSPPPPARLLSSPVV
jgi:hypothetical protein